jgi:hypothetical protein
MVWAADAVYSFGWANQDEDFQVWKPSYYERFLKEGVKKIKFTQ